MKKWLATLGIFVSLFAFGRTAHAYEEIKPLKDEYVIASDSSYAPFVFQDASGNYVGIDVDLMHAVANLYGFNIRMVHPGFQAAIDQVQAGQADGMIAGMSITEARKEVFDFSDPYFQSGIQIAVRADDERVQNKTDLKDLNIGVKNGTTSQAWLQDNQDTYGYRITTFEDGSALYDALVAGHVDGIMDDSPVLDYAINQGRQFRIPLAPIPAGEYGFAVKRGQNPELIAMFNSGLATLKENGQYQEILDKYLANPNAEDAQTVDETTYSGLISNNWSRLLNGLWKTVAMALLSFALAMIVGTLIGLFSVSPFKAMRIFSTFYVDIIRGLPLMVLTYFLFFGLPQVLPALSLNDFAAGILALTLNASAYIAEIVRGGINAVDTGQMEAARSLGLGYKRTMQKIILPQAIKIMVPSFVNQFVISLKDTTIISVIGVIELLQTGRIIVARNFQSFRVYLIIGIMYLVVITALTKLSKVLEKRVK